MVGARPQFVKAAPLCRSLRRRFHEVLVHTGQHYDPELSDSFFRELDIPTPDHHLGIGSGSHGRMTGRMLEALEALMVKVRPQVVVVLGDTNSTLAGALAAVKLGLPVAHVEAGLRSFDERMPEEINRRLTDHVSTLLLCPTRTAVRNLRAEGITRGVHRVGDVMMDAVRQHLARALRRRSVHRPRGPYAVLTLHRQENVEDPIRLTGIVKTVDTLELPVLFPVHPRTRHRLRGLCLRPAGSLRLLRPLPYLEMLGLVQNAQVLLTDSGGLQKEAFILGTPCLTLRDSTEWVETVRAGANRVVGADPARIRRALRALERRRPRFDAARVYGDGHAAEAIAEILADFIRARGG